MREVISGIKWVVVTWKKKEITDYECLVMIYANTFIILFITGLLILYCLIYNDFIK